MKKILHFLILLLLLHTVAFGHWVVVGPGVDYAAITSDGLSAHVSRIDLRNDQIRIISSNESEKGMRTSDWARRNKTLVAINADYFDDKHQPIGLALGPCGVWEGTKDTRREGVVAIGKGRVEISPQAEVLDPVPRWVDQAVSGWPLIIDECTPFSSRNLPGSDGFTRSPHPRTAVGLSGDGRYLYLVVVDGRNETHAGVTLARLAEFMHSELGVCRAINLDGGGSATMVVNGDVENAVVGGQERWVANHLGVVLESDYEGCDMKQRTASAK